MSRMLLIGLLLLPAIMAPIVICCLRSTDPPEITIEVDVYDFRDQWLEAAECHQPQGARYVVLGDIEDFVLRTALDDYPIRQNVYSRPKVSHASGTTISISYAPWNPVANQSNRAAWMSARPCKFTITPTVSKWTEKVALDCTFDPKDCKLPQVQVVVPDESASLFFLEDVSPGVHRAVCVRPRIVKPDRGNWHFHD